MLEDLELVAVITIEAAHGACPQETLIILVEAIDLIIGETIADIQAGKSILGCLS